MSRSTFTCSHFQRRSFTPDIQHVRNFKRSFDVPPIAWVGDLNFRWSLDDKSADASVRIQVMAEVSKALNKWQAVLPAMRHTPTPNNANEDATTNLRIKLAVPGETFTAGNGARGFAAPGGAPCGIFHMKAQGRCGEISLNLQSGEMTMSDLHNTVLHEFGHVLGLSHWIGGDRNVMGTSGLILTDAQRRVSPYWELTDLDKKHILDLFPGGRPKLTAAGGQTPLGGPGGSGSGVAATSKGTGPVTKISLRNTGGSFIVSGIPAGDMPFRKFALSQQYRGQRYELNGQVFTLCADDMPKQWKPYCN
ncbi:hypothetical protein AA313_de0203936 [Arthrobotrys entomopaga]|nr:hypothetical protein AA313_de0203936 [Arthrobotrys entomopaga]